jgi:uncharacterized RDD family membrane protein YckC
MPRKSQRIGPATDGDGGRTMAYRACQPFVCAQCGSAILPDQMFSRRSTFVTWGAVGTGTTAPICVTCRPLHLEEATT